MTLYYYEKSRPSKKKKIVSWLSYGAITIGSLFLFWAFYPVISFEIYSRFFLENNWFNPSGRDQTSAIVKAGSTLGDENIFSTNLTDYTKAGIWFPSLKQEELPETDVKNYLISIPKLGINDAKVIVSGEDLKKGLVHFLPKVFPGQHGNVTIFGHSTLPQLYNVKDYKTIFTYLPTLDKGDLINIKVGDKVYVYETTDKFVVTPDRIDILDQDYNDAYLTLVTCCPPGTYWKRCGIKARLTAL